VHERYWRWQRRRAFGPGRQVPLDFGAELWEQDLSLYESAAGIRAARARAGKEQDEELRYTLTNSLLRDVIEAAGGVEYAHERFRRSVNLAQERYDQSAVTGADFEAGPEPEFGWWSDISLEEAWFALEEMMIWARTLDERLKHQPHDRSRYKAQGLIPALAAGPRREAVEAARSHLRNSYLNEVRQLAALNLHMQSTENGSRLASARSGKLVMRFPDRVTEWVCHRSQLTYDTGRDAASYADGLMAAVERFMEEMFQAFEQHLPERFMSTQDEPPHPTV
jgi:hypothetical protein